MHLSRASCHSFFFAHLVSFLIIRAFAVANEYAGWETDEIIAVETVRNLVLSLVCVFLTTLALIQDLRAVLLVLASVLLTMVRPPTGVI